MRSLFCHMTAILVISLLNWSVMVLLTDATVYGEWKTSSTNFNYQTKQFAIGYYQDTISLLGGQTNYYQRIEIRNNTVISSAMYTFLSDKIYGFAQYYTQLNDVLYILQYEGTKFYSYNLQSKNFDNYWNNIDINTPAASHGCLASVDGIIFVLGGAQGLTKYNTLRILNISSTPIQWISGAPSMQSPRSTLSCITHPIRNELYAIGGHDGNSYTNSTERILIHNILSQTWEYMEDLLYPAGSARSVLYGDDILVLGGQYYPNASSVFIQEISVINCVDGSVRSGGHLDYAATDLAAIIFDDILYAFGGYNGNSFNTWQYLELSDSSNATILTTTIPTTAIPTSAIPTTAIPTSAIPTTAIPTTAIPTTAIPTTAIPTTAMPTSAIPKTAMPTTAIPTSAIPTTAMPTTAIPTTAMPTSSQPTTAIPTAAMSTTTSISSTAPDTSRVGTVSSSSATVSSEMTTKSVNDQGNNEWIMIPFISCILSIFLTVYLTLHI